MNCIKVGFVSIGLDTYWGQFNGLKERLLGYQNIIIEKIAERDVEVLTVDLVDSHSKAIEAADVFVEKKVELVYLFIATYALSSTVLPIAQRVKCPIVLLNIQPSAAIDYDYINTMNDRGEMTGEWLAHCQACSLPEIACVFNRAGIRYDMVTGYLNDESTWRELMAWADAACVVCGMRNNTMGILGHYYGGMLDVYTDTALQSIAFGTHIKFLEMCELKHFRDEVSKEELQQKYTEFYTAFDVDIACEGTELERAAKTSVALDKLVEHNQLGSLAYYYEGYIGNDYENIVTSVIAGNTLLTGKGVPVAGECEVKNVQAMKILSLLGAGGSFSEPYAMDFNDDVVLWGHDGPAHYAIAEGRVRLVPLPLYHGKPGKGLSVQMSVKCGEVTFLSVCEGKDGVFLLVAEGKSVQGKMLNIGNTNSRYKFSISAKEFINAWSKAGPSHHCAIGIGHVADKIKKAAFLLNIQVIHIC